MYKCEKKHDDMSNTSEKGKTGIPAGMKRSFEQSSGFSFDDVRVHYSSEKPAQLHAHAYTQGNDVFVASGQEKHLPHELGHVVQQKSNMVRPTENLGGLPLNTDPAMERNADNIAQNAEKSLPFSEDTVNAPLQAKAIDGVVQMDSEDVYNWTAGLSSTILTGLGMIGGIGSFLYTKYNTRKHRYIEEIEKYSDAAGEALDDAEAACDEVKNSQKNSVKIKKCIVARKAAKKAIRNADIAKKKYQNASERIKNNQNCKDAYDRAEETKRKASDCINFIDTTCQNIENAGNVGNVEHERPGEHVEHVEERAEHVEERAEHVEEHTEHVENAGHEENPENPENAEEEEHEEEEGQ